MGIDTESYIYKFRAELLIDVLRFHSNLKAKNIIHSLKPIEIFNGMSVVMELKSPSSFIDIIRVANEAVDSHIIVETFELKENYTGERKDREIELI